MIYLLVDLKIVLASIFLIKIDADLKWALIRERGANSNRGANSSRNAKPRRYGICSQMNEMVEDFQ